MTSFFGPPLAFVALIALAALTGYRPIRKLIEIREARHELKHGSASFIRGISGWFIIALWGFAVWFFATIIGDWGATGDLDGAIVRSGKRLELLLHILAALGDD